MNNGQSTGYFNLERGSRQDDPLSPGLHPYFVLRSLIYSNKE